MKERCKKEFARRRRRGVRREIKHEERGEKKEVMSLSESGKKLNSTEVLKNVIKVNEIIMGGYKGNEEGEGEENE